jgi:tRNA-specific 2-thiouridylase
MSRIAIAMSGGVDSSVAAALLTEAGHEVTGITLGLVRGAGGCCSDECGLRAGRVAAALGIAHYVWDMKDAFEAAVIEPLVEGYRRGRTPNPCIACNALIKFDLLLEKVLGLGFDALATGHYARVASDEGGTYHLVAARDTSKDQSYALYMVDQHVLAHLSLPLGGFSKTAVRELARERRLPAAETAESQDICFVPDGDVAGFVGERSKEPPTPGEIVDAEGRAIGHHEGVERFTVGQRRGLGVASSERTYVTDVDGTTGRVTVGPHAALLTDEVAFEDGRWVGAPAKGPVDVMFRYRGPKTPGRVEASDGARGFDGRACLDKRAIRPARGQAVVFYRGDEVLGGGIAR